MKMKALVQVTWMFILAFSCVSTQMRYTVLEEKEPRTYIGNVATDMSLKIKTLPHRNVHIVSSTQSQYFDIEPVTGKLLIKDRIDREQLCGINSVCLVNIEIMLENPIELYHVEINILDINDNPPVFAEHEIVLNISENVAPGAIFRVERAYDPDIGTNSVRAYQLSENKHFILRNPNLKDSNEFPELVLERALDREQEKTHLLIMTVYDGGYQQHSAVARIIINILDANDNPPVFSQSQYVVTLEENAPKGSLVIKLNATDLDEGTNAEIIYSFCASTAQKAQGIFRLESVTGAITLSDSLDFEEVNKYELYICAMDKGQNAEPVHCTVLVEIVDVNDNSPQITVKSASHSVPEDAPLGTVVAIINVGDKDAGANGRVSCRVSDNLTFQLKPSRNNYYSLVTSDLLDRELAPEYKVSIWASDHGYPVRSAYKTVDIKVDDVNDNPPRFSEVTYEVYVTENNVPGTIVGKVTAQDSDFGRNAQLSYLLVGDQIKGEPLSTYFSVGAENGAIYALTSLDYEKIREYEFHIHAQDGGVPQLSGSAIINVYVIDTNDNAPEILYPFPGKGSEVTNRIPRSSNAGYLVAKVLAVDADDGHNAWLSYHLLKSDVPDLFSISKYTGEIRIARQFQSNDSSAHILTVMVKDNGRPVLSATTVLHLVLMDSDPEVLPKVNRQFSSQEGFSDLNVYLIICLLSVIFLFFAVLSITVVLRCYSTSNFDLGINLCCRFGRCQQTSNFVQPQGHQSLQTYVEVHGSSSLYKVDTYRMSVPRRLKDDFITIDYPTANNSNLSQQFQQTCLLWDDSAAPLSHPGVRADTYFLV
ncbi:protocadherin gamma-C3-like [Protopterus annectens]|uniref:protocadherin gamma-C3-like n=1 Tax=Protopterus annectens TaxID=7888 RepID=UPI001CF92FAD|nr:protocadherin gamma-C3-like [Protopterus annectens]